MQRHFVEHDQISEFRVSEFVICQRCQCHQHSLQTPCTHLRNKSANTLSLSALSACEASVLHVGAVAISRNRGCSNLLGRNGRRHLCFGGKWRRFCRTGGAWEHVSRDPSVT
jgi:hypothetical protein